MTTGHETHLSEEALHDVLIGLGSTEAEAHLTACAACRSQVEAFDADVTNFSRASLAWCEAKPSSRVPAAGAWNVRHALLAPAGWALAAAVLVTVGLSSWMKDRPARQDVSIATAAREDTEVQIAQDNRLLQSIDVALTADQQAPVMQLSLSSAAHRQSTSPRALVDQ